ncbi:hypothetical protein BZA05DRAFT_400727 [Tricharina praecox]|uniref:uncharacterized protein n=1 Tax=Tricharina praecox TaxID=43433 RepID=UPI00221FE8FE|nr:uncharacterized protein BZA05DRAFT_400727 [Tricharina praecox]KAI5850045.1 hypothetical protein BZA05DRAFT_400727 [Tricharina praecox]
MATPNPVTTMTPDSPTSPTGSKRSASSTAEEMSELIHKAKASRVSPPSRNDDDDESIEELLEKQLNCSICAELYLDPVLVLPCSHNFCGSCAARWLETNNTCPSCRGKVVETRPNSGAQEMVGLLLRKFPEKARPQEELDELKAIYKPGDKINICSDSSPSSEDEEELDDEPWDNHFWWRPCPTCVTPNPYGYVCPDPIPPIDTYHHDYSSIFHAHVKCTFCERATPTDWKPYKCSVCSDISCGAMFTCINETSYITAVPDQRFFSVSDDRSWPFFNAVEKARLQDLRETHPEELSWEEIGKMIVDHILIPSNELRREQTLCRGCARNIFEGALMRWWIWYQKQHGIKDDRVKCWYGFQCRTQTHSRSHAERLNHACEATPLTERVNDAPRVSSSSTPAIGAPPASSTPAADAPLALSTPASDAPVAATFGSPTHDPATPMPLPNIEEPLPSSSTNEAQQELAAAYAIASITGGGEMQGDEEPTEVRG